MSGGGTPDDDVVSVQVVVVEASVEVNCCVAVSLSEVICTVDAVAVTIVDDEIVVVLVFGVISPFSSFFISSFARDDVELRLLNFVMFLARKRGLRTAEFCKKKEDKSFWIRKFSLTS